MPAAVVPAAVAPSKPKTLILGAKKPAAKPGGSLGAKKLATPVDDALFEQRPREAPAEAQGKLSLASAAASSAAASKAASPSGAGPSERFAYAGPLGPLGDDGKPRVTHHDAPPVSGMDFFEARSGRRRRHSFPQSRATLLPPVLGSHGFPSFPPGAPF